MSGRHAAERALLAGLGALLVLFLAAPLVGLFATTSLADLSAGLDQSFVWSALRLSLFTTTLSSSIVVLFGTPLSWWLAQHRGRVTQVIETAVQLPIVIPPAVAGVAMLMAFGRRGWFAGWLYPEGWSITFTTAAVVMAEVFVSAPFFVQAATSAFRRLDPRQVVVARSFGASPLRVFARVALPISAPGIVAGAAMSWARALGEFGATLMFAGNLPDRTQTLPLAIYTALETDLRAAQALAVVLVVVAFALLLFVRAALRRSTGSGEVYS